MNRRGHMPGQVIRSLAEGDQLLVEGQSTLHAHRTVRGIRARSRQGGGPGAVGLAPRPSGPE